MFKYIFFIIHPEGRNKMLYHNSGHTDFQCIIQVSSIVLTENRNTKVHFVCFIYETYFKGEQFFLNYHLKKFKTTTS